MLTLITRPPSIFSLENIKERLKKILIKEGGPMSVEQSLVRGLNELGVEFNVNGEVGETVGVLRGVEALKWAIDEKASGRIKKLIAGPNLVVVPTDHNSILGNPNIDIVIVPSPWVKDFYSSVLPSIADKIRVWPAGVSVPEESSTGESCLIFKKQVDESLYVRVISELEKRDLRYELVEYGKSSQANYFEKLKKTKYVIYLQAVESQGLALQEAWARNIPTLVWSKGYFVYPSGQKVEGNISAPFLSPEAGMFFSSADNFSSDLNEFLGRLSSFTPREYVIKNLSDKVCAENYLKIINE
jgi:hypothetical protein